MQVLDRPFFNVAVIDKPLLELVEAFKALPTFGHDARTAPLIFPKQPYSAGPDDPPLILWSPACAPKLTAMMPHVGSGDYFVVSFASERFGLSILELRSSVQEAEWPINEFIVHENKQKKRFVRAMRDDPHWQFYAEGEPLPYENVATYSARRIRDRFQRAALISYAEAWGAPIRNPDFWRADSLAITFVDKEKPPRRPKMFR